MRKKFSWKKFGKRTLYAFLGFVGLIIIGMVYLYIVAIDYPPEPKDQSSLNLKREQPSKGFYTINNSWFRKSKSGLFEMYVEGKPFERGVINGKLSQELVVAQEDHFVEQISRIVPSNFYRHFLKYFIAWFNRNLDKNVTEEYKEEIYGISKSASDKYQHIGSNYQRILNYHAAHDIGHALQSMALVGCTSFGTWGVKSEDSTMIIGRNFDFYVGDKFAQDKIVAFFAPSDGYKFMTVTWGGFIGAVSGMNEKGVSVTINADKTNIPTSAATPVSLVAREILQYAKNTQEAYAIAKKRKMFVSEAFLVASAADNKAVVIEKTPDTLDIYDPHQDYIVCANHFQSKGLSQSKENKVQMAESASPYRYNRLMELLNTNGKNTVQKTIAILRDQKGLHGENIGMGNEKAINQLMSHHSIVFEPKKLLVWVSTSPWQLGEYVCYDLKKVFGLRGMKQDQEINEQNLTVPADTFLSTSQYKDFVNFRRMRQRVLDGESINTDSLVATNPQYYFAYVIAGDYTFKLKNYKKALGYYQTALSKVIATKKEEEHIRIQIKKCNEKLKNS
ncbi:C45 family autoproteolytic acyltransferase/hydrolase [Mucilaginibacter sp. KACC 22773]|uniref:C45 family autoproteolytic acyltransferase/hydolase n=1 Tax=Mucilaginibacter sp. KACC 22773 TaxID=3025671 RepID=UPI0023658F94|nr:C45 family peptidase [Mucilaginibacter sp. KACC 22773]WDF78232.1 C45 family autoproteolytic acyltransferase/hydrolase [Mucilaginibacter sp. KACC 22773]